MYCRLEKVREKARERGESVFLPVTKYENSIDPTNMYVYTNQTPHTPHTTPHQDND